MIVLVAMAGGVAEGAVSLTGDSMVCVTADMRESGNHYAVKWVHAFVCTNALEAVELGTADVLGGLLDAHGLLRCTIRGVLDVPSACISADVCGRSRVSCFRDAARFHLDAEDVLRRLLRLH